MTFNPGHYGPPDPNQPSSGGPYPNYPHDPYGTTGWTPQQQPQYGPPAAPVPGPAYPPAPVSGPWYPPPGGYQQAPTTGPNPMYPPGVPTVPPVPQGPPAPRRRRLGKGALVGLIVAVVVVCCGIGAIIAATNNNPPATNAGNNPPATTGAPAATAAGGAAGIVAWRDGGGLTLLNAMSADFGGISTAGGNTDAAAMHTACAKLQTDTEAAQAYKPIPDDQAQTHWAKALAYTARAATDCLAGTSQLNADLITQSATEMGQATAEVAIVGARMKALAG